MGSPETPAEKEFKLALSYRMRAARNRLHAMSTEKAGQVLGVPGGTYAKWEERGNPPLAYALRICYLLHVDPLEVLSPKGVPDDADRRRNKDGFDPPPKKSKKTQDLAPESPASKKSPSGRRANP